MTQSNLTFTEGQAIPEGYKKTEVGVIPSDWDVKKLGDISSIYSGGTPNRKVGEYWGGSIPWVTTTLINGGEIKEAQEYITFKGYENSSAKWCEKETILMAMYGQGKTRGKVGKLAFGATINQACAAIKVDEKYNVNYILSFLNSKYEAIRDLSNAGGQENLSGNIVKSIPILIPSLNEQQNIATALSDTDALISELEKLIEKKQAIKTATMQQLLTGKTRLPEFALSENGTPKGYKDSELGRIPEDWRILSFSEVCTFINGRAYGLHEWEKRGIPVIRLQNLTGRGEDYYYSTLNLPAKQYCDYGDLLFMWSATFGPVIWKGQKAIYHYHIWKVICNENVDKDFLYLTLEDMTENLKRGSSSGGTMLHVTKEIMEATLAIFPPHCEQLRIASVLNRMIQEIELLVEKLNKLKNIKQGMMQELLTGRTRLV